LRLESSARGLCAALRLARTQAIVNNRIESVVIDLAGKSYGTSTAAKGVLPNDTEIKLTVADSQRLSGMRAGFSFFPNGGSTGGEIELSLAGKRIDIGVNWLTGEANCGV
jgi:general secretion pathway protein H